MKLTARYVDPQLFVYTSQTQCEMCLIKKKKKKQNFWPTYISLYILNILHMNKVKEYFYDEAKMFLFVRRREWRFLIIIFAMCLLTLSFSLSLFVYSRLPSKTTKKKKWFAKKAQSSFYERMIEK